MKKLLEYIETNWESLFSFLDFYSKHFSNSSIYPDKLEELEKINRLISKNLPTL
jgi:phenylacetate-coenzyme A ligase PaaK-like adenylate-forming protein